MRETLSSLMENVLFFNYENLVEDLYEVLTKMKDFGVPIKNKELFPENVTYYKDLKNINYSDVPRPTEMIFSKDITRL